jgi:hypothetical protein
MNNIHYNIPEHLRINGRSKLPSTCFQSTDKLFRSFTKEDIDEILPIRVDTIRFPDISCNWNRFSNPIDIRYRRNGKMTDGCYSFTVETSRYKKMATPVHDPIFDEDYENFSHIEIRVLKEDEDILFEPPKSRNLSNRARKLEYRQNIANNLIIEIVAVD